MPGDRRRERLCGALENFSFVRRIWPSAANFVLVEVDGAKDLMQQSKNDKVLLRYFGGSLGNCVRITVGSAEENDRLIASLERLERGRE